MSKLAKLLADAISSDPELIKEIYEEINKPKQPVKAKTRAVKKTIKKPVKKKVTKSITKKAKSKKVLVPTDLGASVVSGEELSIIEEEIDALPNVRRPPVSAQECMALTKQGGVHTKHDRLSKRLEPQFITADPTFKPDLIEENQKIKAVRQDIDRRPPAIKIHVKCHVCGHEELISPALAPISYGKDGRALYRCNDCK